MKMKLYTIKSWRRQIFLSDFGSLAIAAAAAATLGPGHRTKTNSEVSAEVEHLDRHDA